MAPNCAATYKILVLGDSKVGKTCIVFRYCADHYFETYTSSMGPECMQKIINLDETAIKLQIWATPGQEGFHTTTIAFCADSMGILLMYDVTSLESFNNLQYWLRRIHENVSPDVIKVLVANKCDIISHRVVDSEEAKLLADRFEMPFFEVSCKENINIEEAFLTLARRIRLQEEVPVKNRSTSLFEAIDREGSNSMFKAKPPAQELDDWDCSCQVL